jgi:DNA-binding transcriptional ArsR family regulator/uncharacterized protein YndB with AHSA1/START domain
MVKGTVGRADTQRLLDALSSPVRREILWLIWEQELPAGDIAKAFELAGPTISEHLAVLRDAGLVTLRKEGTFRRYSARQDEIVGLRHLLEGDAHKWFPGTTPAPLAPARTVAATVVEIDGPCTPADAFRAFTDPALYSRWVGVPVTLIDDRFSATMEWGLEVRGSYDHVIEPSLIVMSWDFEPEIVPVPGASQRAYLRILPLEERCHLELTQLVRSPEQAAYMERAWGLILGRFHDNVLAALDPDVAVVMRRRRDRSTPVDKSATE